jgi:hypothetical protein
MVEIDVQDRDLPVGSPGPIDSRVHLSLEEAAVRQLGELVVAAQVLDPSPVVLALGHVAYERHEDPARAPLEQPDARFGGKRLPVAAPGDQLDRARPPPHSVSSASVRGPMAVVSSTRSLSATPAGSARA